MSEPGVTVAADLVGPSLERLPERNAATYL
jgi:hypothetical protein